VFFFMSEILNYSSAALRTFLDLDTRVQRHATLPCIAGSDSMYIIVVPVYIRDILFCVEE
jgi:hypothetical protein